MKHLENRAAAKIAVTLALALGVLAGCSSQDGGGQNGGAAPTGRAASSTVPTPAAETDTGSDALAKAYDDTAAAGTARTELSIGGAGTPGEAISGQGSVDFADGSALITLAVPGAGQLETRQVDGVVYTRLPEQLAGRLPGEFGWVRINPQEAAGGQLGGGLPGQAGSNPTQALAYLRTVSGDVTEIGREDVRGTATTRYRATADLREAARANGADDAQIDQLVQTLGQDTLPIEVWIDEDGRVRRIRQDVPVPAGTAAGDQPSTTSLTQEFFDFGAQVDVQAPAEGETIDLSELSSLLPRPGSGG
ncbi:hypothetical protein BH24ACT13_BH24ACT13_10820 [soil metagenome]